MEARQRITSPASRFIISLNMWNVTFFMLLVLPKQQLAALLTVYLGSSWQSFTVSTWYTASPLGVVETSHYLGFQRYASSEQYNTEPHWRVTNSLPQLLSQQVLPVMEQYFPVSFALSNGYWCVLYMHYFLRNTMCNRSSSFWTINLTIDFFQYDWM